MNQLNRNNVRLLLEETVPRVGMAWGRNFRYKKQISPN